MKKQKTDLTVENIVVSGVLSGLPEKEQKQEQSRNSKFPHLAHACFPHRSYSPSFPGAISSCKVFLYAHGVMNCVGIKDYEDVAVCVIRAYRYIVNRFPGQKIRILRCAIHNIVASGRLKSNIKLETLARVGKYNVTFQPSKFPGAYFKEGCKELHEDVTVFKMFHSGNYYTVGSNTHRMIVLNSARFPGYVQYSLYNQVCTLLPPPVPPLDELLIAVNASPIRALCADFAITRHPSFSHQVLESRAFAYPGDWWREGNTEARGPDASAFSFRTIITHTGKVYEYATNATHTLTLRQKMAIADNLNRRRDKQDAAGDEITVEDALRAQVEIPIRESTLLPQSMTTMLLCASNLNSSTGLSQRIGRAQLEVAGTHFYIRTDCGLLLHMDGDINVPDSITSDAREKVVVAHHVWKACGFREMKKHSLDPPLPAQLNLKKIAADFNRASLKCRFEPLANAIRFDAGLVMYADGAISRPDNSRVSLAWMWATARVSKAAERRKRGQYPKRKRDEVQG
jgi:TATA-box binding protein (TBP) (component of TFIID and TFIIIB)